MSDDDSLSHYRAKRDFALTPEPADGGESAHGALSFVVQKHWASSLHYDFRLELDGSMKSWAVPKGPSFDPHDKRMAVQVEDHPISYSSFEGSIPAKQYGAGKVIVWDRGSWKPLGDPAQGLREGNLKFELHGHKLSGRWVLVRIKPRAGVKPEKQPPWLLIKEKDDLARPAAEYSVVDALPDSVMALSLPAVTRANDKPKAAPGGTHAGWPSRAKPAALPATLAPQLATLVEARPGDETGWLCEIKFDGYRLLTRVDETGIQLFTRNGHDWTAKLRPLQKALRKMELPPGWYDGEIVVPGDGGVPDFGALQHAFDTRSTHEVVLYLFDLPFFDGHDLRCVPLEGRRTILQRVLERTASEQVRFSEAFDAPLESVVGSACRMGLEGVIAKRRGSAYVCKRSGDWLKLKCGQRQEFVIGGYTEPRGARTGIGALVLGVHDGHGALLHVGNVGSGFDRRRLESLRRRFDALRTEASPFALAGALEGQPRWLQPVLVAEVSFSEWTASGHIRHAVFRGLREDKEASAIVREEPIALKPTALKPTRPARGASAAASHALATSARVTHPGRVIDTLTGTTKIDLVRYLGLVGELMMAHLKGRPVALLRAPSGVDGQLFFQKHAETEKLPGIRQLDPALFIGHPPMLEVINTQGLLSAAQWNAIEFHTLNTGTRSFEHPDRMVFDLDPGEGVAWPQVQEAAQLVQAFLTQLGLPAWLKTSGGKGLHLVVPLRKQHDWDTVKGFSQAIVQHLARTIPQRFVAKSGPKNRAGKIFIDYLRNGLGATTVCAWSARARPGLGISVPVDWSELPSLRGGDHWTVATVHSRLDRGNEPWQGYAKAAKGLGAAMKLLGYGAKREA